MRSAFTVLAVLASFCAMLAIASALGAQTQPALLSAILTLGVSRRPEHARASHAALYPLVLVAVAVVASAVGSLLHAIPVAGAVVFTGGIVLSIWLRNFGERARRIGALVALPFVTMLVVPVASPHARGGRFVDLALVVAAGLVALASVRLVGGIARLARVPVALPEAPVPNVERERKSGTLSVPARMAIQMAVALSLAFAVGFTAFGRHWGWAVLTAFIVCSGAIGRADAAYKGFLRLVGALGGTLAATLLTHAWHPSGSLEAAGIFAALFFGLWLRETNYAYWAACITLVLALLAQPSATAPTWNLLVLRLAAILAGAVCGIVACWFVMPIRTTDVVRRRLADALVALDAFVASNASDPAERGERFRTFDARMRALDRIAAPVRHHRRLLPIADHAEHPGRWIELADACRRHVAAYEPANAPGELRARVRRAIGAARKAIGAHGRAHDGEAVPGVTACLDDLRTALHGAVPSPRNSDRA